MGIQVFLFMEFHQKEIFKIQGYGNSSFLFMEFHQKEIFKIQK
jgi:hypothetical protein